MKTVKSVSIVSGVTNSFPAPALAYTVTETGNAGYTQEFSGACDTSGRLTLSPGDTMDLQVRLVNGSGARPGTVVLKIGNELKEIQSI